MSAASTIQISVRLAPKMHAELVKLAEREFSTLNREANIAIRAHLDRNKRRAQQ